MRIFRCFRAAVHPITGALSSMGPHVSAARTPPGTDRTVVERVCFFSCLTFHAARSFAVAARVVRALVRRDCVPAARVARVIAHGRLTVGAVEHAGRVLITDAREISACTVFHESHAEKPSSSFVQASAEQHGGKRWGQKCAYPQTDRRLLSYGM